jgi:hypothetical protein
VNYICGFDITLIRLAIDLPSVALAATQHD